MSTEAALLAAVRAAPDDDLPRLALADWLDEYDDPARAEFIRVQVRIAAIDDLVPAFRHRRGHDRDWLTRAWYDLGGSLAVERRRLAVRERELLAAHGDDWAAGLPWGPARFRHGAGVAADFVRGLPAVAIDLAAYAARVGEPEDDEVDPPASPFDRLAALSVAGRLGWVDEVRLYASTDDVEYDIDWGAIAAHPALTRVTHLDLRGGGFGGPIGAVYAALAGSPHLGRLRWLDAGHEELPPPDGLVRLPAPELRFLRLGGWDGAVADEVGRLAVAAPFPRLEELDLAGAGLLRGLPSYRRPFDPMVFAGPGLADLRRLDVSRDRSPDGLLALLSSPHLPARVRVDWDEIDKVDWLPALGLAFVRRLAELPGAARLRVLPLAGIAGTRADAEAAVDVLLASPHLGGLEVVRVGPYLYHVSPDARERLLRRFPVVLP